MLSPEDVQSIINKRVSKFAEQVADDMEERGATVSERAFDDLAVALEEGVRNAITSGQSQQ